MLAQQPDLDALVVPVGGGGLIAGIAVAAKAVKPDIQIIGVQMQRFPAMVNLMQGSHLEQGISTIAEGIAVGAHGPLCAEARSEEHTSELQSLMRNSYAVFCLKKKKTENYTSEH